MAEITDLTTYRDKLVPEGQAVFQNREIVEFHASDLPDLNQIAYDLAASIDDSRANPSYDTRRMETLDQNDSMVEAIGTQAIISSETAAYYEKKTPNYIPALIAYGNYLEILRKDRAA